MARRFNLYFWCCLLLALWLVACGGGAAPAPAADATPTTAAVVASPVVEVESAAVVASPTPDRSQVVSPEIASEVAFPTPTAPPVPAPVQFNSFVDGWAEAQPLTPNDSQSGTLQATAGTLRDGTFFDMYEFTGSASQYVTLNLDSNAFDALLMVVDSEQTVIGYNDDGDLKQAGNSALGLVLPKDGNYRVIVTSYEPGEGNYTLANSISSRSNESTLTLDTPQAGWLVAGDAITANGLLMDEWAFTMPDQDVLLTVDSVDFDMRMEVYAADGTLISRNGDRDRIGSDYSSRLLLPVESVPLGTALTVSVALEGEFAVGGAYTLRAAPFIGATTPEGVLTVRAVIVKGTNGQNGSMITEADVRAAMDRANEVWNVCGIRVVLENDTVQTVALPGLDYTVTVQTPYVGIDWTPEENTLMYDVSHARPQDGITTSYFVRQIGQAGESAQYGFAYPTMRYPSARSGMLLVGDNANNEAFVGTLAHELGHLLGLSHPDLDDGDPYNDYIDNAMFSSQGTEVGLTRIYGDLSPMQCQIARAAPRLVRAEDGGTLAADPLFTRHDRILLAGESITGTLTTRDAVAASEPYPYLDVYYLFAEEGEEVTVTLTAETFDAFLLVEDKDGERLAADDDSGGGSNAEITFIAPATGDYSIGVTAINQATGDYTLSVTAAP